MTNENKAIEAPVSSSVEDVIALLIKHHNIHEGHYILNLSLEMAAGQMPLPSNQGIGMPSLHFAITGFSLQSVPEDVPNAVSAAIVNPKSIENIK